MYEGTFTSFKGMSRKTLQKNQFFVCILKVIDENSRIRIRIRIHQPEAWIRGSRSRSGSTPKCHGYATLARILLCIPSLWHQLTTPSPFISLWVDFVYQDLFHGNARKIYMFLPCYSNSSPIYKFTELHYTVHTPSS